MHTTGNILYAHSLEGLKISIMRKNPTVCFQVDTMKDMADWESVLLWGTFEELTNEKDIRNCSAKPDKQEASSHFK